MSDVQVPVRVLRPVGNFKEGDTVLLSPEEVKVLWRYGLVEVIDKMNQMIGEVDQAIFKEKDSEPLTELPKDLFQRAEFWIWYAENCIRGPNGSLDTVNVKLTKLANLKLKLRTLRGIRLKKLVAAAVMRPHSDAILARLTPEEAEVYEYLSDVAERWLG